MVRTKPFEQYLNQYEKWFHQNKFAYQSEIVTVKRIIPINGKGIEIGVGSGRFAVPLGIRIGVDPSYKMIRLAVQREVLVIRGVAEALPIRNESFDFVLMITTICFLDDIKTSMKESYRILNANGCIIVGFVDKESLLGKQYQRNKNQNVFYRDADFFSVNEVVLCLKQAGFHDFSCYQTIHRPLKDIKKIEHIENGHGKGSFVVIKAEK